MAEVDDKSDKEGRPEGTSLLSAEAQAARNAGVSDVKAIQSLNKNSHSGSAGNDQNESIQIIATDLNGQQKVIAARQPERLESISIEELILKGRRGDQFAIGMVQQMRAAAELPGVERSKVSAALQDSADKMYRRSEGSASNGSIRQQSNQLDKIEKIDTQTMKALAPSSEVARSALEIRQNIEKHMPAGPDKERLIAQLKADVSPALKAHVEQNVTTQHEQNEWQAFTKLTQKQQRTVIEAFQTGSNIGQEAYEQKIQAVSESIPRGFYNVGKELYDCAIGAGTFLVESVERPAKLEEATLKLSESLAAAFVSGMKISHLVANYGQETAQSGDYNRLFGDLQTVTTIANERWEAIPLEKRTEKASEVIADMGLGSVIGAADKLAKSGKLIDGLENLAKHTKDLTAVGHEKARQALGSFLDDIFQPQGLTPDGSRIAIPHDHLGNRMLSKADDLSEQRHKLPDRGKETTSLPEKFVTSERFINELKQAVESLSEGERSFLQHHGIEVKAIRRMTEVEGASIRMAGCFKASEKAIYVPEEIMQNGNWIANNDVAFIVRHEFGHALNAKSHPFGAWISDKPEFINVFKRDFKNVPLKTLDELQLSRNFKTAVAARDEVFADVYAHATGNVSQNPYSQKLKLAFPNCFKFLKEL